MTTLAVPKEFIWRRVQSLMGLWLVLFLMEHLLVNSQAALWLGDNGRGFIDMVNGIHNFPYLQAIEALLLGVPILIHGIWGLKYLLSAKFNYFRSAGGSQPILRTQRNGAYTWQRITSWIILFMLIFHVVEFRFLDYPTAVRLGDRTSYLVTLNVDPGLYTVADRLDVTLYDQAAISRVKNVLGARQSEEALVDAAKGLTDQKYDPITGSVPEKYDAQKSVILTSAQKYENEKRWVNALESQHMDSHQVIAVSKDFGTASLLNMRDHFKSPLYIALYTIFVLAACFHACNGFWTFLITWGWVLKKAAQRAWVTVSIVLMLGLIFLGLAAIWGTFWMNLRY